jgi:hypothetical protein
MLQKHTIFFVDGRNNGFSNSLYIDQGTTTLIGASLRTRTLLQLWAPLLGTGVKATYVRVSFDGIRGDGNLSELPATAEYSGDPAKPMEQAGSCIQAQMSDVAFIRKKNMFMHGVWDTAITGGALATPPTWNTKWEAFIAELKSGWGWKGVNNKVVAAISAVAQNPNSTLAFTADADVFAGPFDGRTQQVQINGVDSIPRMKNPVIVRPIDARHASTVKQFVLKPFVSGQITVKQYGFFPAVNVFAIRATTHRVGRPFRPQAGGRSARR